MRVSDILGLMLMGLCVAGAYYVFDMVVEDAKSVAACRPRCLPYYVDMALSDGTCVCDKHREVR